MQMPPLRQATRAYVGALALAAVAFAVSATFLDWPDAGAWALAVACVGGVAVAWRFPLHYTFRQSVCADEAVATLAVLLLEPGLACLAVLVGAVAGNLPVGERDRAQVVFNAAQAGLATAVGGLFLGQAGWHRTAGDFTEARSILVVAGLIAVMYVVNTAAVSIIVALESRRPVSRVWGESVVTEPIDSLGTIALAGAGAVSAALLVISPWLAVLMAVPVVAMAALVRQSLRAQGLARTALDGTGTMLAQAQRIAGIGSFEWDLAKGAHTWSDQTYAILGVPHEPVRISHDLFLEAIHPFDRLGAGSALRATSEAGQPLSAEVRVLHRHGAERLVRLQAERITGSDGTHRVIGAVHDVTDQVALRAELVHRASHDGLTGLANRASLLARLDELVRPGRLATDVTVVYLDVDDFKRVNDALGHPAGDRVLVEVAERIRACIEPGDVAARFGGDEFVILLSGPTSMAEVRELADRLGAAIRRPLQLGDVTVDIGVTIGIAATSEHLEPVRLLADADTALYHARFAGTNRTVISSTRLIGDVGDRPGDGSTPAVRAEPGAMAATTGGRWLPYVAADGTAYHIWESDDLDADLRESA